MDTNEPEDSKYFIRVFNKEEYILGKIVNALETIAYFEILIDHADVVGTGEDNPYFDYNTGFAAEIVYGKENIVKETFDKL
jgi:hypothetical protein